MSRRSGLCGNVSAFGKRTRASFRRVHSLTSSVVMIDRLACLVHPWWRARRQQRRCMARSRGAGTHRANSSRSRPVASSCLNATSVSAAMNCFEHPSP